MSTKQTFTAVTSALMVMMLSLATNSFAQTNLYVTPAQYLASQPKPNFASGYHLPNLTMWLGGPLSSNDCVQLATHWGYCLPFDFQNSTVAQMTNSPRNGYLALATNNPSLYKLSLVIFRTIPSNAPSGFFCTNSAGMFVDANSNTWPSVMFTNGYGGGYRCVSNTTVGPAPIVSPQVEDDEWTWAASNSTYYTGMLHSNSPIAIILNGGEEGLSVPGPIGQFGSDEIAWAQDPRVQSQAVVTNPWSAGNPAGMSWPHYASIRKANELSFYMAGIRSACPDRQLYIFYTTGNEQLDQLGPSFPNWFDNNDVWGWWSSYLMGTNGTGSNNSDLPSFEDYYANLGSWTNNGTGYLYDLLTKHLDAVGYEFTLGWTNNYSWLSGGWSNTDTNRLSDIPRYTGFLKCLYTAGMIGGVAGYFTVPTNTTPGSIFGGPGYDATFPTNSPPHWLLQMMALSHTHALFSHLENFLTNGDLLSGPQTSIMSTNPAYEFTNTTGDAYARTLVRKLRGQNQWLVTAWAADGNTTNVTVNIPTLGNLTVSAIPSASVYQVTMSGTNVQQTLLDEYNSYRPAPPVALRIIQP